MQPIIKIFKKLRTKKEGVNLKIMNKKTLNRRRTHARLKDRRRRIKNKKRKYMIYYIFFAIIIISTSITLSLTAFFKIEHIKFKIENHQQINNSNLKIGEKEILNCINLEYGDNLIRFDSEKAIKKLLKNYQSLSEAEIIKHFPDSIIISCYFGEPIFFIETNPTELIGIAESGRAITLLNINVDDIPKNILIVKLATKSFKPPQLGQFLTLPQKEQQTLQRLVNAINQTNLNHITKIEINTKQESVVTYENRIDIEIQNQSKIDQLISIAKRIIEDHAGPTEEGTIRYFSNDKTIHLIPKHKNYLPLIQNNATQNNATQNED